MHISYNSGQDQQGPQSTGGFEMNGRFLAPFALTGAVIVGMLLSPASAVGQTAAKPAAKPAGQAPAKPAAKTPARTPASKTPWGDPDLQGVYTFSTLTPLQR